MYPPTYLNSELVEAEKQWARPTLDAAAKTAEAEGTETETVLVEGSPAEQICRLARERNA